MKNIIALSAGILLLGVVTNLTAHHSAAMFDYNQMVVLKGTLKSFIYQAPHSWISVIGGPEGAEVRRWDAETGAPSTLVRLGITRDTIKPGDQITMGIHPLRDGRAAGAMVYVITADGKVYGTKPGGKPDAPATP